MKTFFFHGTGFDYERTYKVTMKESELQRFVDWLKQDENIVRLQVWEPGCEPFIKLVQRDNKWESLLG